MIDITNIPVMTEQQVFQEWKKIIRFANFVPNYTNKQNEYNSKYLPKVYEILYTFEKQPNLYTQEKIAEMKRLINDELKGEQSAKTSASQTNKIVKKKLQIFLNNYYSFFDRNLATQLQYRNNLLQGDIKTLGDLTPLETLKTAMDEAVILILRDANNMLENVKANPRMDPKMAQRQTARARMIMDYVKNTFYNTNPAHFTVQKKNELENRMKNKDDIIIVEGFKERGIGIM
jgi:hypothetical protein